MMKFVFLAAATLGLAASVDVAGARVRHHHHHLSRHQAAPHRPAYPVTVGYGETIIDGKTGFHRSDFGVMVPDGTSPNFILSGRRSGSGLGANGLPGSNLDNE